MDSKIEWGEFKMETTSKVSIIIPVNNGEKTISKTLDSCLKQTHTNLEIIVIDNLSTDKTKEKVLEFNDSRISYNYLLEKGRSLARNKGIELASGEYIQFLDADDTLDFEKIKKALEILEGNELYSAVQCQTDYIKNNEIIKFQSPYKNKDYKEHLFLGNTLPIHSVLIRKRECAFFPENFDYCEDWYFWIKSLAGKNIYFDGDYIGAHVFIHDNNTMSNYSIMKAYYFFVIYLFRNYDLSIKNRFKRACLIYSLFLEYDLYSNKIDEIEFEIMNDKKIIFIRTCLKSNGIRTICKTYFKKEIKKNAYSK